MTPCTNCEDTGLVPFVFADNPKPDSEITAADLHFALCLCAAGLSLRNAENCGHRTNPLWHVWAAEHQIAHERVHLVEDVYAPEELTTAGLRKAARTIDHEAAMVAAGRRAKR